MSIREIMVAPDVVTGYTPTATEASTGRRMWVEFIGCLVVDKSIGRIALGFGLQAPSSTGEYSGRRQNGQCQFNGQYGQCQFKAAAEMYRRAKARRPQDATAWEGVSTVADTLAPTLRV